MTYKLLVFSLAIVMLLSIGLMADLNDGRENQSLSLSSPRISPSDAPTWDKSGGRAVVWDNGMNYEALAAAQYDDNIDPPLDPEPADDFIFDVDQMVNDVHWIGGYWNGPPDDGDFDWTIRFFADDGTGNGPGLEIASFQFANAAVNETWLSGTPGGLNFYSYSVNLPTTMTFVSGTKYWISIQGIGVYPPQSGWAYHTDQILLHMAVFRSDYFVFPDWTNSIDVFGVAVDMCFQLTYEEGCSWQPGDPHKMHFPQLPDEAGWDVNATEPMVLADDFMCMKSGPILDIHWWGSWKHGIEGEIISFVLSIHADIPADPPQVPYSRPGITLWEREVTDFDATPRDPPSAEGWYDPASGEVIYDDHQAYFQYDVCFDPTDPDLFVQDSGVIYWLNISAIVVDPFETQWGWKSTQDHWNDDAVWAFWGELNWIDIWEPAPPLTNEWGVAIDPLGNFLYGYGEGAFHEEEPWFYYEWYDWWNVWFYDHPFDTTRKKYGQIVFDAFPIEPTGPRWLELAVNWSTDMWFYDNPGIEEPPLPGVDEDLYIGREILFSSDNFEGQYVVTYEIPWYNPEWVSVDVRGFNFDIPLGIIEHICQGSLDLAFVITGEEIIPDSGACCYDPTGGGVDAACIYTTQTECEQILGGVYQGTGVPCTAPEACCLANGDCVMADPLCCVNELGGTPQGAGSQCTATEACCFTDGSCQNLDPLCCSDLGGTPQGIGTSCSPVEACCLADGTPCRMVTPECCDDLGGTPQGPGTNCAGTIACCFPDGTCQTVSAICCDDLGGIPSPFGAPQCLGDLNGDGTDDACQIREDLKWRQAPDLDPTGMDVDASCESFFAECLVLADDYLCTQSGPITEIHVYGSWYEEMYPGGDPGNVFFTLSIHEDVPAGIDQPWSHPGEVLWMKWFSPGEFMFRPYAAGIEEGFFNPIQEFYQPIADFTCWKYIFVIPEDSQFVQEGSEGDPVVYWLDVQAHPNPTMSAWFGWKTSLEHWNDDATWAIGFEPVPPPAWMELRYPPGHPFAFESIDLAFEIYGTSQVCDCVPGDANGDGSFNIGDAVYIISYVFQGGPPPTPYRICSGDPNCDCQVNVADAVYMINYIFKGGPPPCSCLDWVAACGWPLRK